MCQLTPHNRDRHQKLTSSQIVKKFPAFYGARCSLPHSQAPATCPYPEPDQSTSWRSIFSIFLPSTPRSSKWLFSSGLPSKTLCASLLSPLRRTYPRPQAVPLVISCTHPVYNPILRVTWASLCLWPTLAPLRCQTFRSSTSCCFNMEHNTVTMSCLHMSLLGWGENCLRLRLNPLTPNDLYISRTSPLTSKRCILYIY